MREAFRLAECGVGVMPVSFVIGAGAAAGFPPWSALVIGGLGAVVAKWLTNEQRSWVARTAVVLTALAFTIVLLATRERVADAPAPTTDPSSRGEPVEPLLQATQEEDAGSKVRRRVVVDPSRRQKDDAHEAAAKVKEWPREVQVNAERRRTPASFEFKAPTGIKVVPREASRTLDAGNSLQAKDPGP